MSRPTSGSSFLDESPDNPYSDLLKALSALHLNGKYSDLVVTCKGRRWFVHRALLCSRSGFFDGACSSDFREAGTGIIDLSDDDVDAVEQMINFFYQLDYLNQPAAPRTAVFRHRASSDPRRQPPRKLNLSQIEDPLLAMAGCYVPQSQEPMTPPLTSPISGPSSPAYKEGKFPSPTLRSSSPPLDLPQDHELDCSAEPDHSMSDADEEPSYLLLHTRVYALAEKYDIPSLKTLARHKFEVAMACFYDSSELPNAIEEVYCGTIDSDRGLRNIVMQAFRHHPDLASTHDIRALVSETPSLKSDLVKLQCGALG